MMNWTPRVSVMVVAYNQAHLIRETLDSILSQDYPNLEVVVADDASTDGTQDILREYAERSSGKMRAIFNPHNLGITANCNVAWEACAGELVALFAGDDVMLPGKITAQVKAFLDPDVALCYHPVIIFDSVTGRTLDTTFRSPRDSVRDVADLIARGGLPGVCSAMVRRSACPPTGLDTRLATVSDWMFLIEVALNGKLVKLDGVFAKYRKHPQGASNRTYELLEEVLHALDLVVEKYPGRPELADLCRQGKARYLAGEVVRQLAKNTRVARELATRTVALDPRNSQYRALLALCRVPPLARLAGLGLKRAKYLVKRHL